MATQKSVTKVVRIPDFQIGSDYYTTYFFSFTVSFSSSYVNKVPLQIEDSHNWLM